MYYILAYLNSNITAVSGAGNELGPAGVLRVLVEKLGWLELHDASTFIFVNLL